MVMGYDDNDSKSGVENIDIKFYTAFLFSKLSFYRNLSVKEICQGYDGFFNSFNTKYF